MFFESGAEVGMNPFMSEQAKNPRKGSSPTAKVQDQSRASARAS